MKSTPVNRAGIITAHLGSNHTYETYNCQIPHSCASRQKRQIPNDGVAKEF